MDMDMDMDMDMHIAAGPLLSTERPEAKQTKPLSPLDDIGEGATAGATSATARRSRE